MSSRMDDLLVSTAQELKDGRTPLNHNWLVENEVTFDEAVDLADQLVTAIHTYRATTQLAMKLTDINSGEKTLAENIVDMSIRQGGPFAVMAEAARLEERAHAGA